MRRRAPIFQAVDDQLFASGLQPDRHELKRLLWEHARNVVFWNGAIKRKIPAALAAQGGAERVAGISQQSLSDGTRLAWFTSGAAIYSWAYDAPTLVDPAFPGYITDTTATERATMVDFTHYGDWTIINNSKGKPKINKPGVGYSEFAEPPADVVRFLKRMNFLMAIGYGPRGTQVGWSDADKIDVWGASASNLAGSITIDEFNTPIRAGAVLGDAVAVYSEDQMALVRYIGAPFVFSQRTTLDGIGCVGKYAVATDTRQNVGVSRAGCWWTDGNSSRFIDEGYLSDYLQDNVNWDQAAKIVVGRNDYTGCFEFHFPMLGSHNVSEAWSWDPRNGAWSPTPAYTCMDERRIFQHVLYGDLVGKLLFGDFNEDGVAPLALRTRPLMMTGAAESAHIVSRVDEYDLLLHAAEGIEVRIGCCGEPNGVWRWAPWQTAAAGNRIMTVPLQEDNTPLPENPYWKLEFRSTITDWALNLQGFVLYGISTGTK